ncbi:MAG: DUF1232 domain-containing protein [Candidatus Kapabacteria bacterium]|nr:DUF1232 domain-containing protein [Candidatus Kapabacteria bacterium]
MPHAHTTDATDTMANNGLHSAGYMKERLMKDAERITEQDYERLRHTLPEKMNSPDLRELQGASKWIGAMLERVALLYEMIRDREFNVSTRTKALVGAGLLYFVLPSDIVPDFLPGIGYLDDALILTTLWNLVRSEIESYADFRRRKANALQHI